MVVASCLFEGFDEGLGAFFGVACGCELLVEGFGGFEAGCLDVHGFAGFDGDLHVFDEVFDVESGFVVFLQGAGGEVVEGPAAGCAFGDALEDGFGVEPGVFGVGEAFAHGEHSGSDGDLVGHFCVLAAACWALINDVLAHELE